jgi:hypothetical protein
MLDRGLPERDRASARTEGLKVKLDSQRVHENVATSTLKADKVVGPRDEGSTGNALESLCTVSAHSFYRVCG